MLSCSNDDSSSSSVNMSLLARKWYYVSVTEGGVTTPYDGHEACGKDYIEFTTDGVVRQVDVFGCDEGTPQSLEYAGTYTTSGNKITSVIWDQTETATVKTLNEGTLKVTYKDDLDNDGDEETITRLYTAIQ
jgi:hypothetical protein